MQKEKPLLQRQLLYKITNFETREQSPFVQSPAQNVFTHSKYL
jgi:hypothetical protein